jgi:hypothetical protein
MYYRAARYKPSTVEQNPKLGLRLEKIKDEDALDHRSKEFLGSLLEFFNKKGGLTANQLVAFEKIESRFSPEEKAKLEVWKEEYLKNHVADTKIVAEYYSYNGYFSNLADNILKSEGFVPTRREYTKMVENKYAQKVLDAHRADPRFGVNQVVQIRSTVCRNVLEQHLRHFRHRRCFVLANDLPIKNSTAGAKRYRLLPMGSSEPIELDEKHLMKPNRKGKTS